MPNNLDLPHEVIDWVRSIFKGCNERISEKLSNNPNVQEESLDFTWVEYFSQFASPITFTTDWTAKIETHYLGGLRHWGGWEIADIGLLVFIKQRASTTKKVALLQSKRLYPSNNRVREDNRIDYEIGFARLADPEDLGRSVAVQAEFEFTENCQYGAMSAGSKQVAAIQAYERQSQLKVYYQLYNSWTVPFIQRIPLEKYGRPSGSLTHGVRIVPATAMHACLSKQVEGHRPTLAELKSAAGTSGDIGWQLEDFAADLLLGCTEGSAFKNVNDEAIQNLFYRRSGPISAAISITIEEGNAAEPIRG